LQPRFASTVKLAAPTALAALGFYAICQLTVATWIARDNAWRDALRAEGRTPWEWTFSDPESIVARGSVGLSSPHFAEDGLHLRVPDDGAVDLSLALRGEHIDVAAVDRLELELSVSESARVMLVPQRGTERPAWVEKRIDAGSHALSFSPQPMGDAPAEGLQLRIDTVPGAELHFSRLALRTTPASSTPMQAAAPLEASTPEILLAHLDAQRARAPSSRIELPSPWRWPSEALARALPAATWLPAICAAFSLALVAIALHRRRRGHATNTARRAALEAFASLLPCVVLLLAGWPMRGTNPPLAMLAFLGAIAALPIAPVAQPPWRGFGDARAWRDALLATLVAALLLAPLALLPDGDHVASRSGDRFWRYPLWALIQQFLLLVAIAPRCLLIAKGKVTTAAWLTGIAFALLHLPNFALVLATLSGGMLWAILGFRHRALLPLAASHAVLGLWLTQIAPTWLLRSAEVGGRFLMAQ